MKKILFCIFLILLLFNFGFSQKKFPELEKIKKIKIFESNQKDVQKLLPKYIDDESVKAFSQVISADIGYLTITFSEGNCGEDEYWNVKKGLVTGVGISNFDEVKVKDLGFDLKNFKKEIKDKEFPEEINYHDEKKGIFIRTDDGEVEEIVFYPPKSKKGFLCTNENTAEIISGKERLVDTVRVIVCILINKPPVINKVILSESEVFANDKDEKLIVPIRVHATDPENDVLAYEYKVSGGKIIGEGATVDWDLTNVKPGIYTITVGVDDGAGVLALRKSKTVLVK